MIYLPKTILSLSLTIFFIYNTSEIKASDTSIVKPTQNKLSVKDKKRNFRSLIVPAVNKVYSELDLQYKQTIRLLKNNTSIEKIAQLKKSYNVSSNEELLMALKPHPKSIAIAQAAIESAWGTSRFFKKANNLFGVWASKKSTSKIAALKQRGTKTIWLKKYSSIEDSIRGYYKTLAKSKAYREFRELKMKTDNPYELVKKLDRYSERRKKYTKELSAIIKYNKFYMYDK